MIRFVYKELKTDLLIMIIKFNRLLTNNFRISRPVSTITS